MARQLADHGHDLVLTARRISLDVDVANDRALGLYTSVGFTPITTEDYFALPLS